MQSDRRVPTAAVLRIFGMMSAMETLHEQENARSRAGLNRGGKKWKNPCKKYKKETKARRLMANASRKINRRK